MPELVAPSRTPTTLLEQASVRGVGRHWHGPQGESQRAGASARQH